MSTLRVAIAGATGYAGEELIRILRQHPSVQLTALAASAKWDRPHPVAEVFPRFAGQVDLPVESLDPTRLTKSCDVAFLALPHGLSMDVAPTLLDAGRKVIDLAGDFRLKDATVFEHWYGKPHSHPELLKEAVYGVSELFRDSIRKARLVANPGCYATSVILACAPLLERGIVDPELITVDSKSGITGSGRKTESTLMFPEMDENMWAYKVNSHQHAPEIEQAIQTSSKRKISLCFVPHVVPLRRGILSTIYMRLTKSTTWEDVNEIYSASYREAPFVRLRARDQWPQIRDVQNTNYCDLGFTVDDAKRLLIVVAAIDNLTKGAAGGAVQNLNLMYGFDETAGLE